MADEQPQPELVLAEAEPSWAEPSPHGGGVPDFYHVLTHSLRFPAFLVRPSAPGHRRLPVRPRDGEDRAGRCRDVVRRRRARGGRRWLQERRVRRRPRLGRGHRRSAGGDLG